MIYIAICDDNEKTVEILKKKVMEFLKKSNEFADITVYTQSENLQYDIQEGKYYDLILSDIEMPNIDGMKEKGITCNVNVEFPQNTNIKPHDMCTILANLLDNAIEASEKLKIPGNISLTIRRINHFLLIKVSNACEENKESFAHFPSTTKKNREFHGWGLPSVKDAVEKYNGTLKCINEEKQFIVKIMLFFEKNTN